MKWISNKMLNFSSKILLFGEYSILKNAKGLGIPYDLFQGHLICNDTFQSLENTLLKQFFKYLKDLQDRNCLLFTFDDKAFQSDLHHNLFFNSSIPWSCGLGSSGALCAAVYERYTDGIYGEVLNKEQLLKLKKFFAQMESFFHGCSSGFDPLISFYNKPILMKGFEDLDIVESRSIDLARAGVFLFDTKEIQRTAPFIDLFLKKCIEDKSFENLIMQTLLPLTQDCILAFLKKDHLNFSEMVRELSLFQLKHFTSIIPVKIRELWKKGLESKNFTLKLCGAGAGGILLGFTDDMEKVKRLFASRGMKVILPVN